MMNVSTHGKSRFSDRLDKFFWFAVMILPLAFWLFLNVGRAFVPASAEEQAPVETKTEYDYYLEFYNWILPPVMTNYVFEMNIYQESNPDAVLTIYCINQTMPNTVVDGVLAFKNSDAYKPNQIKNPQRVRVFLGDVENYVSTNGYRWSNDVVDLDSSFTIFYIDNRTSLLNDGNDFYIRLIRESKEPVVYSLSEEDSIESEYLTLGNVMTDYFGMDVESAPVSIVANVFNGIFAKDGIFPFFEENSGLMYYFVYFVYVQIIHVLVDVLVFIPRFAHKILDKAINFGD